MNTQYNLNGRKLPNAVEQVSSEKFIEKQYYGNKKPLSFDQKKPTNFDVNTLKSLCNPSLRYISRVFHNCNIFYILLFVHFVEIFYEKIAFF